MFEVGSERGLETNCVWAEIRVRISAAPPDTLTSKIKKQHGNNETTRLIMSMYQRMNKNKKNTVFLN